MPENGLNVYFTITDKGSAAKKYRSVQSGVRKRKD